MKFYKIISVAVLFLGILHCVLTPMFYNSFNIDAVWFIGAGLAFVLTGAINFANVINSNREIIILSRLSNLAGFIYSFVIMILLPEPQAVFAFVLMILLLLSSVKNKVQ